MPLFFFISGLVFTSETKPFFSILGKYCKQLLIPYYLFAILTYGFALISQTAGDISWKGIAYQLAGILYGNGNNGMLGYNVVLWFLPCLFVTKLTFAAITRKVVQTNILLSLLGACALSGYLLSTFVPWIKLPFGFEIALTGLVFFGAGYLLKIHKQFFILFAQQKALLAITAMLCMVLIATINYHISGEKIDMRVNQFGNILLFYLGAFGGIIAWVTISRMLAKNIFLEYIGKHSLVLFAWHNVLLTDLKNVINSIFDQDALNTIPFFMPTFYASIAISIILFSRMVILKLTGYRIFALLKQ